MEEYGRDLADLKGVQEIADMLVPIELNIDELPHEEVKAYLLGSFRVV